MLNELVALLSGDPAVFAGSAFVVGLMVGSFLNVVIYRLPMMLDREWRSQAAELLAPADATPAPVPPGKAAADRFNLSTPGSACPTCKAPIKAWQNIPVLSWLMLRGR